MSQSPIVRKTAKVAVTHLIHQIHHYLPSSGLSIPILRRQSHAPPSEKDWFDENTDIVHSRRHPMMLNHNCNIIG